jgi:hypothetical protein
MTERIPIVLFNNELRELPLGDTLRGVSSATNPPDEVDFSDQTYFYFGWLKADGSYNIERQIRSDSSSEYKTGAWASRTTLW